MNAKKVKKIRKIVYGLLEGEAADEQYKRAKEIYKKLSNPAGKIFLEKLQKILINNE